MNFDYQRDFATSEESLLASLYPITLEQSVIILALSDNKYEIAEKACKLIADGIPYNKVRMMIYRNEI